MQRRIGTAAGWTLVLLVGPGVLADETADRVQAQKAAALANWKKVQSDAEPVTAETKHFLLYSPASMTERQLKAFGTALDAQLAIARRALQFEPTEEVWTGKVAVFLFDQREHFASFVRSVEKRRLQPEEHGSQSMSGDFPHVVAGPGAAKYDPTVEQQAGEQLAAALLSKRGGKELPDWLVAGFARATAWRAAPTGYAAERQKARAQARLHTAKEVINGDLKPEVAPLLRASLADYLAYGPKAPSFIAFVEGFKPDEEANERTRKSTWDALKAVKLSADRLNTAWQIWVGSGR